MMLDGNLSGAWARVEGCKLGLAQLAAGVGAFLSNPCPAQAKYGHTTKEDARNINGRGI